MKAENPYVKLFQHILPPDTAPFFDPVDVTEKDGVDGRREFHPYPDGKAAVPAGYNSSGLSLNGFYGAGSIQDFPVRDRRVHLPVRRRRWLDSSTGKSVSKDRDPVARGTRHPKEFAAFLKGLVRCETVLKEWLAIRPANRTAPHLPSSERDNGNHKDAYFFSFFIPQFCPPRNITAPQKKI